MTLSFAKANVSDYTEILWDLLNQPSSNDICDHTAVVSRSTISKPPSPILIVDKPPSLFALVIGIDEYATAPLLTGAVADANEVQRYLEYDLKVPSCQIRNLRNEEATRDAIIQAFSDLRIHPGIKRGDPILIFYAGHGAEAGAPPGWEAGGPKIQTILPQNYCTEAGNEVYPIPDRTVGALLNSLAEEKGDNITVVFDCCYSGSGTRNRKNESTRLDRFAKVANNLQTTLDQDFWQGSQGDRSMKIAAGFLQCDLRSHVLLAACSAEETAKEDIVVMRGEFTKAFLDTIRTIGADKITYTDLIQRIPQLPEQNPQCEGHNRNRIIFDSKAPSPGRVFYTVRRDGEKYVMDAGSAQGITDGAEFAVYVDRDSLLETPPLGKLVVLETRAFSAVLDVNSDAIRFPLAESAFALQIKVGTEEDLRLHIVIDEKLVDVFKALAQEMQITGPEQRRILLAEKENAELDIALENGRVVFNILDPLVTKFGLTRMPFSVSPQVKDVYPVIRAAAHYRWHLRRTNKTSMFQNKVRIEFKRLTQYREPDGPDLNADGVIDLVVDEKAIYGLRIINDTTRPLYPSLFYFDNSDFSITPCYQPPTAGKHKVDPPLKPKGSLPIGYGAGGSAPFEYFLQEGQAVDVGFMKLFLTTEYVDFSNVSQASPFDRDRNMERIKIKSKPVWDTMLVTLVQRKG